MAEVAARSTNNGVAYALIALCALCWSGNHVVGRAIAGHVPPFAISTLRWVVPAIILAPFALPYVRRDWPLIRQHRRIIIFLALIGGALFGALQYIGLQYTTAINVSVLNSLAPVLIAASGALLFGDTLAPRQMLGISVSLVGVLAIVTRGDYAALSSFAFNWGDLIIIFNMGVFGIYSACLRLRPAIHWVSFIFLFAVVSGLATVPFWLMEHSSGFTLQPTTLTFGAVAYVSIFPSLVAYIAWNRGVELIGSNRAGAMLHLIAIYSALLAGFVLGERLMPYHFAGFALILMGVWLAARKA